MKGTESFGLSPGHMLLLAGKAALSLGAAVDRHPAGERLNLLPAPDGRTALATVAGRQPDLVLVDAAMADMSAVEFCEALKGDAASPALPIIVVAAEDDLDAKLAAFAAGCTDCVSASVPVAELVARIDAHIAASRARGQLLHRNEQLDTALASLGHGVCFFDRNGRLVFSNNRYAEVYGLDPSVIRPGQTLEDILTLRRQVDACPRMTVAEYLAWAEETNAGNGPQSWVLELRSGKVVRGHHQRTADGGWVSTHEDITQAWHAERALAEAHAQAARAEQQARAAHAHLLDAFEVVPEGLALFDAEDRFVLWNRRYEQIYTESGNRISKGMRFEERLREGLKHGQYPEAAGREEQWLAERLALHAAARSTHEQRLPGNRWIRIDERRTSDGGSVGIRVDITDLKQREASFRLLFESNPVPMCVYDCETLHFIDVNQATLDHYGYSRDQFLSMTLVDLRPKEEWRTEEGGGAAGDDGDVCRHLKADGMEIEVMIYSSCLNYANRAAALIALVDVTERKRAEQALLQHRDILEETVRSRTAELARQAEELERMLQQERQINELQRQFVAMASHEFRTPLAIIDGAAQRLVRRKDGITQDFLAEKTDQIRSSVSRILELMESILAVGRLDHGRVTITLAPCSLADVIATCSKHQESIRKSHRFQLDLERLPASIPGDRPALEQVFTNLFSNAVKYAPHAPIVHVRGWQDDQYAHVSIRDEGIGIDADDLPRMFQRYFRARTSTGIAGTGIGLNLVKQIVELHGGTIEVASQKGNGTTFTLRIPVAARIEGEADCGSIAVG